MKPGALMRAEIAEQPAVLAALAAQPDGRARGRRAAGARPPRFVLLAARGTSDHAALYAKYLVEIGLGLPAGLASPVDAHRVRRAARPARRAPRRGQPVGRLARPGRDGRGGRRACGARMLAVTNAPGRRSSPSVDLHVGVGAGPERAVAATKTYTAELLALWLVVQAWRGGDLRRSEGAGCRGGGRPGARRGEVAALAAASHRLRRPGPAGAHRAAATPTRPRARRRSKLMETALPVARTRSAGPTSARAARDGRPAPTRARRGPAGAGAERLRPGAGPAASSAVPTCCARGPRVARAGRARYTLGEVAEDLAPVTDIVPLQWLALEMALATRARPRPPARTGQGHPHLVTRGSGRAAGGALRADAADPDLPDLPVVAPPHEVGVGAWLEPPEVGPADRSAGVRVTASST